MVAAFDDRYANLGDAGEWVAHGFSLDDAVEWADEPLWGGSIEDAAAWHAVGAAPWDAAEWWDEGWSPEEAAPWVAAGIDYQSYEQAMSHTRLRDCSPADLAAWRDCGFWWGDVAFHVAEGVQSPVDTLTARQRKALDRADRDVRDGHITIWRDADGVDRADRQVAGAPERWWEFLKVQGRLLEPEPGESRWTPTLTMS